MRRFYVSYSFALKDSNGFGSVTLDLIQPVVGNDTIVSWRKWIEKEINAVSVTILFYKEFEDNSRI